MRIVVNLLFLILAFIGINEIKAQNGIVSSGGESGGTNGSITFSIGQLFFSSFSGNQGYISEGVQQPFEIHVITEIEETNHLQLGFIAYPNPTNNYLVLSTGVSLPEDLSFVLYNISGRVLESQMIGSTSTTIDFSLHPSGIYILKIFRSNAEQKTFKIIKN